MWFFTLQEHLWALLWEEGTGVVNTHHTGHSWWTTRGRRWMKYTDGADDNAAEICSIMFFRSVAMGIIKLCGCYGHLAAARVQEVRPWLLKGVWLMCTSTERAMLTKWFWGTRAVEEKVFKLTVSMWYEEMASNLTLGEKNTLWMWCNISGFKTNKQKPKPTKKLEQKTQAHSKNKKKN